MHRYSDVYYADISAVPGADYGSLSPWQATTPLPVALADQSVVAWGNRIYVIGGVDNTIDCVNTVYWATVQPDGSLATWQSTTPLPQATGYASAIAYNGYILVIGGQESVSSSARSTVWRAAINPDGTLGSWSSTTSLPQAMSTLNTALLVGDYVYVVGGHSTREVFSAHLDSMAQIAAWTVTTPLPSSMYMHWATGRGYVDGWIFAVAGGSSGSTEVYCAWAENGNVGSWSKSDTIPSDTVAPASGTWNEVVYVIGSYSANVAFRGIVSSSVSHLYVNGSIPTSGDGTSWAEAKKTIGEALALTPGARDDEEQPSQVWVAAGTYDESVSLPSFTAVYGGFLGNETDLSQRNWAANRTIIDATTVPGDIHTVSMVSLTSATLDGFTVTGGHALFSGDERYGNGGGLYCKYLDYTNLIANCRITGNSAWTAGGGVTCQDECAPRFVDCEISRNWTGACGGGIASGAGSSPSLRNCVIDSNFSGSVGGGAENYLGRSMTFVNCIFSNNRSNMRGGGLDCHNSADASIVNCVFHRNSSPLGGAIYCSNDSDPTIVNSVFSRNSGCAIYEDLWGGLPDSDPSISNCLFFENTGGDLFDADTQLVYTGAWAINTLAEATDNLTGNPCFRSAYWGNFQLRNNSPCIDTGTFHSLASTDFLGFARPVDIQGRGADSTGTEYDIGAYEYGAGPPPSGQTGLEFAHWTIYE